MKKIMVLTLGKADAGCGHYALEIIKRLAINNKIIVFKSIYSRLNWSRANSDNIEYHSVITYRNKFEFILTSLFVYPFLLLKILGIILLNKVDVLYIQYFNPWEYLIIKIFRLFNKKVIYTVHDGVMHYGERDVIQEKLQFLAIQKATDIIFLTDYVKNLVSERIKIKANINVIPHGILELSGVIKHKPPKEKLSILFLGRVSKYKGVELLLQAMDYLDYAFIDRVVIAGKSNYDINYPNHKYLEVIDKWLSEDEIITLLNNSDVIVLPYLEASQSGVVTFAIGAQIPVICTNVGGLKEQLGSNSAVFVEPDALSIAHGVNLLAKDKNLFNMLQENLGLKLSQLNWNTITLEVGRVLFKGDGQCAE